MLGDVAEFVSRMRRVLPKGWFADEAAGLSSVLSGIGVAWSAIYTLIETVRGQARISTSSGIFLDMESADFFGGALGRRAGESDALFRARIAAEMLRPRATRSALVRAMFDLTGKAATIFEPTRPADTGGYGVGGVGWGVAGGYGSLSLPYQSFLTVSRPSGGGIAILAGYGTGGVLGRGSLALANTPVSDADIYQAAHAILPAGYGVWVRIVD